MYLENQFEDITITFRDVSYDEEAEELIDHNVKSCCYFSMRNVSNYIDRPVKDKNIVKIHIYHLHYDEKFRSYHWKKVLLICNFLFNILK